MRHDETQGYDMDALLARVHEFTHPHPVNAPARERALAVLFNQVAALVVERWTDGQPVGLILRRMQRLLDDIDAEESVLLNGRKGSTP